MMTEFTPFQSFAGGLLIGLAATLLMLFNGRIAGITGILGGLLPVPGGQLKVSELGWRAAFVAGLLASPLLYFAVAKAPLAIQVTANPVLLLASALIVGIGATYGAGCPSGHGICGLARFSGRSLAATSMFMATAALTVFVTRHVLAH